ncbi:MAG TPA: VWA domain-containing protein [Opitutaceae bacterium]|nr:VWA domain-containing protein [Opitutaceae bacterium]
MSFYWPNLLWLLFAPIALLAWELARKRAANAGEHPKILRAEAGLHSLNLTPHAPRLSPHRRWWLAAGLILAILALARPQWGRIEEPVFGQSREILIALDLSRSMNSPDVRPSRLARAKLLIQSLLDRLQGERVGLVVFSGTAFLQSPLSADYEVLREFLPALNTDFLPEGGTNYRDLLQTALDSFSTDGSADRYLIILSDGEATDDDWQPLIDGLKKKNIRVIGLGVGTAAGTMIPDGTGNFVKDDRGAVVLSKLESSTLRELAETTGGTYTDASTWVDLPALLDATIDAGRRGEFHETTRVRLAERFQWALAPALLCLLISFWREFPVHPRARALKLEPAAKGERREARDERSENISAGASAAIFCLLASGLWPLAFCPRASAAESNNSPADPLAKVVGQLSTQESPTAHDWADLARTTLTYGQQLQGTQQPVPAGPVRDALAAVDTGEALDAHAADWPKLRRDLAALKKKPDEQKPPPPQQQKQPQQPQKNDSDKNQQDSPQNPSSGGKSQQDKSSQSQKNDADKNQQSSQQKQSSEGQSQKDSASSGSPQNQQPTGPSAFGDMKEKSPAPTQPAEARELQKFGGVPEQKTADAAASDPVLAVPLQKLDQLKQQDSPAALYELLRGENKPAAATGKNW